MNNKRFFKILIIVISVITILPQPAFCQTTISEDELIGKGNPNLYGEGFKLRKDAYLAFKEMQAEAIKSNLKIGAVSSYRSFAHQKRIWERKFKSNEANGLLPKENIKK
ncbi:MAG: D-alanyl-D-alanine carboxypeptidase family protein [Lacinutrix sp.]|uniref:D-alanyl-D-alanine carboxypeptidase family protein n=1 Tax=Lacinutrix sp. TaxID=1937692 RepID=UPI00309DE3AD